MIIYLNWYSGHFILNLSVLFGKKKKKRKEKKRRNEEEEKQTKRKIKVPSHQCDEVNEINIYIFLDLMM